jgi:PleD family two-component response regulator
MGRSISRVRTETWSVRKLKVILMDSKPESFKETRLSVSSDSNIYRLNFRSALVIEESELFRCSMVEYLKHRGWMVHGVRRVEQAFPILQQIPYNLILIDCDISEMTGTELYPIVDKLCRHQATRLVVIAGSNGRSSSADIAKRGVFFAKRSSWKDDVSRALADIERPANVVQQG